MKPEHAREIIECLPRGRTLFPYGKDLYAFQLLQKAVGESRSIQNLKQSPFGRLLEKPAVRNIVGRLGKPTLSASDLAWYAPSNPEVYRLSLATYDGIDQKSRKGVNLVLQLNLNERDARFVEKHIPERANDPFEYYCHPVSQGRHRTLAWSRIDLDLDRGEALIEEIQNDRIRDTQWAINRLMRNKGAKSIRWGGVTLTREFLIHYWEDILAASRVMWDEAMLAATLRLLIDEIGIQTIYYHTPESGICYKGNDCKTAPTSLYTQLPRKFCFSRTNELPSFLKKRRRPAPFMRLKMGA